METKSALRFDDSRFLAVLLWICAAGALWLLVSPAAMNRRALDRRVERAAGETERAVVHHDMLELHRDSLEGDPSTIELEARRNGFGRPDERVFAIPEDAVPPPVKRIVVESTQTTAAPPPARNPRKTVSTVVMVILGGAALFLFLRDLRI